MYRHLLALAGLACAAGQCDESMCHFKNCCREWYDPQDQPLCHGGYVPQMNANRRRGHKFCMGGGAGYEDHHYRCCQPDTTMVKPMATVTTTTTMSTTTTSTVTTTTTTTTAVNACQGLSVGLLFMQIGNFRLFERLANEKFIIGAASTNKTCVLFRSDGQTYSHASLVKDFEGYRRPPGENVEGIRFGDRFVQVGSWRFGDVDGHHFSIQHSRGKVAMIFNETGMAHPGPRTDYGTMERAFGPPQHIALGDRFLQIGEWRLGDFDSARFSLQHRGGRTAMVLQEDGATIFGDGSLTDYGTWDRPFVNCTVDGLVYEATSTSTLTTTTITTTPTTATITTTTSTTTVHI